MSRHARPVLAAAVAVAVLTVIAVLARQPGAAPSDEPTALPSPTASASPTTSGPSVIGVPDRVRIEKIGVNAPVISVGTAADNSQEVPRSLSEVGWWEGGQRPGQRGNAVVVGHTASRDDGVFDQLDDVKNGDVITVSSGDDDLRFRVTEIETVPVAKFGHVADEVYRTSGPRGLVLMTCGDWSGVDFESTVIVHTRAA